jgi:hypothetical protein
MQKSVDVAPEFPEAHRKLGHLHDILGDPLASVRHMKLAVQVHSSCTHCSLIIL